MCGIVGFVLSPGAPWHRFSAAGETALRLVRRRGPDGFAVFAEAPVFLAQSFLLIRDPEQGLACHVSDDERVVCCMNGQVYNTTELRRERAMAGLEPRSGSDLEIVANLWARLGERALALLSGNFALALYDRRRKSLVLARDRFGIRPLYVHHSADHDGAILSFASEPTVLTRSGLAPDDADEQSLFDVAVVRQPIGGRTMFRDVFSLAPGEALRLDAHGLHRWRFASDLFDLQGEPPRGPHPADAQPARVLAAIGDAVRTRVPERCSYAAFLSGGIDSTLVHATLPPNDPRRLRSLACGFRGLSLPDERDAAKSAARALGLDLDRVSLDAHRFIATWPFLVESLGMPLMFNSSVPIYWMCRRIAAHGGKVVISGEGADEAFLGYARYRGYADRVDRGDPELLLDEEEGHDAGEVVARWLGGAPWANARRAALREALAQLAPFEGPRRSLARKLRFDRRTFLVGLLTRLDGAGLSAGVEGRVPFLDHRMVAFAAGFAEAELLGGGIGKAPLRRALADRLGGEWGQSPKIGFPVPAVPWLAAARFARLRGWLNGCLDQSGLFVRGALERELARLPSTDPVIRRGCWTLANAATWWARTVHGASWIERWLAEAGTPAGLAAQLRAGFAPAKELGLAIVLEPRGEESAVVYASRWQAERGGRRRGLRSQRAEPMAPAA